MLYLLTVSIIWAFSFGLIKHCLVGGLSGLDPSFVAWSRMAIALPVFLPFLSCRRLSRGLSVRLIVIGAVQYGLMYATYLQAFRFLDAYQVALFTIFTPLYVTLINDIRTGRFHPAYLAAAALAVLGAAVILIREKSLQGVLEGFLFMQASNVCFAFGQIEYRRLRPRFAHLRDREVYGLLYLGAVAVTALVTTLSGGWDGFRILSVDRILILLYLGVLASGLCFFWWNKGAVMTNAGTLAVFNNMKIPLAVAASLLVFGEKTDMVTLILGGFLMFIAVRLAKKNI